MSFSRFKGHEGFRNGLKSKSAAKVNVLLPQRNLLSLYAEQTSVLCYASTTSTTSCQETYLGMILLLKVLLIS